MFRLIARFMQNAQKNSVMGLFLAMLFFWAIADGIMSFVSPIIITEAGISDTMMGVIIGSSSIAGAVFDILLVRFLPNTNFRRVFLAVMLLSFAFPLLMSSGTVIWLYLAGMAVWGLYFDLYRIASYDFVSRGDAREERSGSFGIQQSVTSFAGLLAPLLAGYLIAESGVFAPVVATYLFLGIATLFYFALLVATRRAPHLKTDAPRRHISLAREFRIWRKLGGRLFPVLVVTLMASVVDGFYWTIGPLFAETLTHLGPLAGLFMVSYSLPPLLIGWSVGSITRRYGNKRTAIVTLLLGSATLGIVGFLEGQFLLIAVNFISSFFMSISQPAIAGAYADYISEAKKISTEIETMEDMFNNMGWVIGPVAAGIIADLFGYHIAFAFLGAFGALIALILLFVTPKSIRVSNIAAA